GWLLLSVISALAVNGLRAATLAKSIGGLMLVVVVTITIGPVLVRTALQLVTRATRTGDHGPAAAAIVVLVTASAAATQALGYEPVLGAFACGILIGRCGDSLRPALDGLRTVVVGVLAPVFFAPAGLRVNLAMLARPAVLLAGLAVLTVAVVGKLAGAYLGARASQMNRWESLGVGAGLNARGVIEIIIATIGI